MPADSAVAAVLRQGAELPWSRTEVLLAHVWQASAHSKEMHPMLKAAIRATPRKDAPQRAKAIKAAKARAAERRRAIAAGEIT